MNEVVVIKASRSSICRRSTPLALLFLCLVASCPVSWGAPATGNAWALATLHLQQADKRLTSELTLNGALRHAQPTIVGLVLSGAEYFKVTISKPGTGISVTLVQTDGGAARYIPCWHSGPAEMSQIARKDADYSVELRLCEEVPAQSYALSLSTTQVASSSEHLRVAAEKATSEADLLLAEYRPTSRRAALRKYTEALGIWSRVGDRDQERRTLVKIGNIHVDLGDSTRALNSFAAARTVPELVGDRGHSGRVYLSLARIFQRRGETLKATDYCNSALETSREHQDQTGEAEALFQLGEVYYDEGQIERALKAHTDSEDIWRRLSNRLGQAWSWLSMAEDYSDLSDFDAAWNNAQKALQTFKYVGEKKGQALSLTVLGHIRVRMDRYQDALNYYDEARKALGDFHDLYAEATLFSGIANANMKLGDDEAALEFYKQAFNRYKNLQHNVGEAFVLYTLAGLYFSVGQQPMALTTFDQCIAAFRKIRNARNEAYCLRDLGIVYESIGDTTNALSYFERALPLSRQESDERQEAYSLSSIGHIRENAGDLEGALEYYRNALHLNEKAEDHSGRVMTLYRMAKCLQSLGRLTEAREYAEAAISSIEQTRADVGSFGLRTSYFASVRQHYDLLLDILMAMDPIDPSRLDIKAFETSERARARTLLDSIKETRTSIADTSAVGRQQLERQILLRRQLDSKTARYTQVMTTNSASLELVELNSEIRRLTAEYEDVEGRIRLQNPHYAELVHPEPLSLAKIQTDVLDENSILLEYSLGEQRSYLWAVTRETFTSYVLPPRSEIETKVRRIHELMTARSALPDEKPAAYQSRVTSAELEYPRAAAEVSRILLGPVTGALGTRRLLIVSEGILQYLPFGALPTPSSRSNEPFTPLIVDHEIVNLPSASTVAVIRNEATRRGSTDRTIAVFADAVFNSQDSRVSKAMRSPTPSLPSPRRSSTGSVPTAARAGQLADGANGMKLDLQRLPATRLEAEAILAMVPDSRRLAALGFNATRGAAMNPDLNRYRIVHFATHTVLNDEHPNLSSLVFSLVDERGNPQDGWLRLRDMYNLKLSAELVVLSACETALGKEVKGEGLMSMVRGFMYSGTPRVLASLWKVDDDATAELMKEFYTQLLQSGLTPAAALRQAQITQMKKRSTQSPFYWAAFQLQGEWR